MSDADDVLLGRVELERAFTALGERLAKRGVVAQPDDGPAGQQFDADGPVPW